MAEPELEVSKENDLKENMPGKWNYHPALPLQNPSIFQWPPQPGFLMAWFRTNWLMLSERVMMFIVAVLLWYFFYPSLDSAKTLALGWVFQIYVINFVLMVLVAGSLHWYFNMRKAQGKKLKFEGREINQKHKRWTFKNQVLDNMFWSLGSGVFQLTIFQAITMWMMANGYAPTITLNENPIWFVVFLLMLPMWSAFHFYWVHRLLHTPFLYRTVHSLHHRNIDVGPWSGLSMHPVEHLLYYTTFCIHWVVASHPIHLYFHVVFEGPGAAMTHTGYEELLIKDKRSLKLGTFYHQLHHRFFKCNYGNQEMPLDRWFGTFHDGSSEASARIRSQP